VDVACQTVARAPVGIELQAEAMGSE
jgi:hypothetical protein